MGLIPSRHAPLIDLIQSLPYSANCGVLGYMQIQIDPKYVLLLLDHSVHTRQMPYAWHNTGQQCFRSLIFFMYHRLRFCLLL